MKTPEAMKGRKLLIRLREPGIEPIRPDGLHMATAKVTKYYTSNKWVDLEYVVEDEKAKLHLDRKFYRTDCTPVAFAQSRRLKQRGGASTVAGLCTAKGLPILAKTFTSYWTRLMPLRRHSPSLA